MRLSLLPLLLALAVPLAQAQITLPITFDDTSVDYELRGFEGASAQLVADPADAENTVGEFVRAAGAATFAGVVMADVSGLASPIPFAQDATTMSVRVWTPAAGTPVRLKVENADASATVETQVSSRQTGAWETLVFDFSNPVAGPPLDPSAAYTKVIIFFDFGLGGATTATTYYWDDVAFGGDPPPRVTLPVTFDDAAVDYELNAFEGAEARLVADPTDATNTVAEFVRTAGAGVPAGVTVADRSGFAMPIPFAAGATTMSVRTWSPTAGTTVRLKVEKAGDPTTSVETEATTTVAGQWETLAFDFANEAPGTAALNLASEYTKASIFFDFGREGATTPTTYYWENLAFGEVSTSGEATDLAGGLRLLQSTPNPVSASATIRFSTPRAADVSVEVYTLLGQRVATLVEGTLPAGDHAVTLDVSDLASGTYVYRLRAGAASATRSLVVAR